MVFSVGAGILVSANDKVSNYNTEDCSGEIIESFWGTSPVKYCEETGVLDVEAGVLESRINENTLDINGLIPKYEVVIINLNDGVKAPEDSSPYFLLVH